MKKLHSISALLLLLVTFTTSAQIITSKEEAKQKGVYSYADKDMDSDNAIADATQPRELITEGAAAKKNNKNTKDKKEERARKIRRKVITDQKPDPDFIPEPKQSYFAQQLVNNAMMFEGVTYRTGGTTMEGMDCSGMVYTTFNIFDISLPRSSYEMATVGTKIKLKNVKKGDLLFFDNNPRRSRINHVGLVTEVTEDGEIKFLHASLQAGVIVSSMNESYYENSFVQANRVIEL